MTFACPLFVVALTSLLDVTLVTPVGTQKLGYRASVLAPAPAPVPDVLRRHTQLPLAWDHQLRQYDTRVTPHHSCDRCAQWAKGHFWGLQTILFYGLGRI